MKADSAAVQDHRPIYIQIAEALRARILSGYYTDKIDGELKLVQEWKVSRRTMQQAIEILVEEGLLGRQQGTGTFVNHRGVARRYRAITSITDSIRAQGFDVSYRILDSGNVKARPEAVSFFRLPAGAETYRHLRLVMADGKPVAVADTLLNAQLLPGIELSHLDKGLYDTLRTRFGRTIVHAEDSYRPAVADAATAKWLNLAAKSAIFIAERRAYDQAGLPIELSTIQLVPVPLDISISQIGANWIERPAAEANPWEYRIGFGDFSV